MTNDSGRLRSAGLRPEPEEVSALRAAAAIAEFSPGPWHAWMIGKTICVLGKEYDHDRPIVTWGGFDGCNRALRKQKANAHLIATAPELYELVRESLYHLRLDDGAKGYHERALAALRKVRADTPNVSGLSHTGVDRG